VPEVKSKVPTPDADTEAETVKSTEPAAATPPPGAPAASTEDNIATKTQRAIDKITSLKAPLKPGPNDPKPQKVPLGSLKMREPTVRLDQISMWRDDGSKAAPTDVWDGTDPADVQAILPALVMAKNPRIKDITLRIAMTGVYIPAGMTDMDYINWRVNVLMAQKHPELAARLLNVARLGRDSAVDAVRRTGYELAADETEAACVESMAEGDKIKPFWQGMAIVCARHMGDANAVKNLTAALPDGPNQNSLKTAAASSNADDLDNEVIKASGITPVAKAIPDNQDILDKLSGLLSDITIADDPVATAKENKGQLLLLALGALRAEHRGDDTQKITDQALTLAGF
jgi:hypothetical protein